MSEYTPGPWRVSQHRLNAKILACDAAKYKYVIGTVFPLTHQGENARGTMEANARLIAAAPELFEALVALTEQYCDLENMLNQGNHEVFGWHMNGQGEPVSSFFEDNDQGALDLALSAIAKATGSDSA